MYLNNKFALNIYLTTKIQSLMIGYDLLLLITSPVDPQIARVQFPELYIYMLYIEYCKCHQFVGSIGTSANTPIRRVIFCVLKV